MHILATCHTHYYYRNNNFLVIVRNSRKIQIHFGITIIKNDKKFKNSKGKWDWV